MVDNNGTLVKDLYRCIRWIGTIKIFAAILPVATPKSYWLRVTDAIPPPSTMSSTLVKIGVLVLFATDTTVENAEATVLSTGVKRTSALLLATSTVAAISLLEATAYSRTV